MKKNGLFSIRQYAFLSGRSTTLQLLYVLERWTEILDNRGSLDAIYFDFMKAFDTIPHKGLIGKRERHGISKDLIEWDANCSVISSREQVNFQWDDDEVRFVLDQQAELDIYSASSL